MTGLAAMLLPLLMSVQIKATDVPKVEPSASPTPVLVMTEGER